MKIFRDKGLITSLFFLSFLIFTNFKVYSSPIASTVSSIPVESMEKVKKSIWWLTGENGRRNYGTGFFISPTLFVTNFVAIEAFTHDEFYLLEQKNPNKKIKIKKLLALSAYPSLALLETKSPVPFYLKLNESPHHLEEEFFMAGYFSNGSFHVKQNLSIIKETESDLFLSTSHPPLTVSGSPLINSDGEVLGISYAHIENVALFTPKNLLNDFLKKNVHSPSCKDLIPLECLDLAFKEIHKKASQDDEDFASQRFLYYMYYQGIGVERNMELAYKFANIAAGKGSMIAQYALSSMYYSGIGVEKRNLETSAYWLNQSAEQSFPPAKYILDRMRSHGIKLPAP